MLCHLLTKLELTASASMAQRLTDDCVFQWVNGSIGTSKEKKTFKKVITSRLFNYSAGHATCGNLRNKLMT